ncbi:MAG: hypothetical protein HY815_10485 [Candidatus Riflebacteria bacterium]|nr:hypothetical protein [Candidatus Riflebacteria bacterium]
MINPELHRGLRTLTRPSEWVTPLLWVLFLAFMAFGVFFEPVYMSYKEPARAAHEAVTAILIATLVVSCVMAAYRAGHSLAEEIEKNTFELLAITGLGIGNVVRGRVLAAAAKPVVCALLSLPFVLPIAGFAPRLYGHLAEFYFVLLPASLVLCSLVGVVSGAVSKKAEHGGAHAVGVLLILGAIFGGMTADALGGCRHNCSPTPLPAVFCLFPLAPLLAYQGRSTSCLFSVSGVLLPGTLISAVLFAVLSKVLYDMAVRQLRDPHASPLTPAHLVILTLLTDLLFWSAPTFASQVPTSLAFLALTGVLGTAYAAFSSPDRIGLERTIYREAQAGKASDLGMSARGLFLPLVMFYAGQLAIQALVGAFFTSTLALSYLAALTLNAVYLCFAALQKLVIKIPFKYVIVVIAVLFIPLGATGALKNEHVQIVLALPFPLFAAEAARLGQVAGFSLVYNVLLCVFGWIILQSSVAELRARVHRVLREVGIEAR